MGNHAVRFVMFYHSLVSDWGHGNAHFLRGVASELLARGHRLLVLEPAAGWSRTRLEAEYGRSAIGRFERAYPTLRSVSYGANPDLDQLLDGADVVLVHERTDPTLIAAVGQHRAAGGRYHLLFHDTHHRSVTRPDEMATYRLEHYDGVLTSGEVIGRRYLTQGWAERVWIWREAADHRVFRPVPGQRLAGDLVWIGNWGDEEPRPELEEYLIGPAEALALRARVYGVRYPPAALERLARAGIEYAGGIPNFAVPGVFARFRLTVHVSRPRYVDALPGIPAMRVFEALACGIPLVCSPREDPQRLFTEGRDYLVARDGEEMRRVVRRLMTDEGAARSLAEHGRRTILSRHTCVHRVNELLEIVAGLNRAGRARAVAGSG